MARHPIKSAEKEPPAQDRAFFDKLKTANRQLHQNTRRMTFEEMVRYMDNMTERLGITRDLDNNPRWADGHLAYRARQRQFMQQRSSEEDSKPKS